MIIDIIDLIVIDLIIIDLIVINRFEHRSDNRYDHNQTVVVLNFFFFFDFSLEFFV